MSDQTQQPVELLATAPIGIRPSPTPEAIDEEESAKQELARITPSNEKLREMARKCGPLPKWLDEDEVCPF